MESAWVDGVDAPGPHRPRSSKVTMMVPKEKFRLGEGLPARFAGDQGFSRLCSLLEINREERKAIVGVIRRARASPVVFV